MDEAVAQAVAFAGAVVIAMHTEAGDLRMVNRVAIITVVATALLCILTIASTASS